MEEYLQLVLVLSRKFKAYDARPNIRRKQIPKIQRIPLKGFMKWLLKQINPVSKNIADHRLVQVI